MGGVEEAQVLPSMATDNDNGLTCSAAATPANENAPAMSLFDNGVVSVVFKTCIQRSLT